MTTGSGMRPSDRRAPAPAAWQLNHAVAEPSSAPSGLAHRPMSTSMTSCGDWSSK